MSETAFDQSRYTLQFRDAEIEGRFWREFADSRLGFLRFAAVSLLLVWLSFGVIDYYVFRPYLTQVWILRFGICGPALMATYLPLFWSRHLGIVLDRYQDWLFVQVLIVAFALTALGWIVAPQASEAHIWIGAMCLYFSFMVVIGVPRLTVVRSVVVSGLMLCLWIVAVGIRTSVEPMVVVITLLCGVAAVLLGVGIAYSLEATTRRTWVQSQLIEEARSRADGLIESVLPTKVAETLRYQPRSIAERHRAVTVLFADLVGFTRLSETMTATELVGLLSKIFARFDARVVEFGLEKIKTIGDAYMVAAGVPEPRDDHIEACCALGLALRDELAALAEETGLGEKLQIRLGVHTGPVTAGVIGRRKFAYDLWGDTVNTASRMESHGAPGHIHVSRPVAEALQRDQSRPWSLSQRGEIEVKGKGIIETWWLGGAP